MHLRLLVTAGAAALVMGGAAHAAQGLSGAYYVDADGDPGSVDGALTYAAANTPNATFTANLVCFPDCVGGAVGDDATLSQLLNVAGGNASNLSNDITGLSEHVLVLNGFLNIATTANYSLALTSDDGSRLFLDGAAVLDNDGQHATQTASGSINLTAGSHAITVVQWENGGGTDLALKINGQGVGGDLISSSGGVPEPASWALMISGFGLAGAALRRRRGACVADVRLPIR